LGAACWWGEAASAEELPPGQDLPVFSPPTLVSLRLAPGAELRLAERVDLVAQAPLHLLLAGAAPVVDDQRYLEGTPGMSDLREPGRPVPLAFGLTAGAQVRLGGRAANPRAPRLGEDELD
jgi:hypothetical protein